MAFRGPHLARHNLSKTHDHTAKPTPNTKPSAIVMPYTKPNEKAPDCLVHLENLLELGRTSVDLAPKTKDLMAALNEYNRKVAAGELATTEEMLQYLKTHAKPIADEVERLQNKKNDLLRMTSRA